MNEKLNLFPDVEFLSNKASLRPHTLLSNERGLHPVTSFSHLSFTFSIHEVSLWDLRYGLTHLLLLATFSVIFTSRFSV